MKNILTVFAVFTIFLLPATSQAAPLPKGVKLIKEVRLRDKVTAAQYELANGLTVVLLPNKLAPLTSVYHWVKAGSLHETPGITGIAHLFEHMMFRPLTPDEPTFFMKVKKLGVAANAFTEFAMTVYTSTVPTKNLHELPCRTAVPLAMIPSGKNSFKLASLSRNRIGRVRQAPAAEAQGLPA